MFSDSLLAGDGFFAKEDEDGIFLFSSQLQYPSTSMTDLLSADDFLVSPPSQQPSASAEPSSDSVGRSEQVATALAATKEMVDGCDNKFLSSLLALVS